MADIELVIKIDEELYKDIKEHGLCGYCSDREIVGESIAAGTPLPKGHGRLIDADQLPIDIFFDDVENAPTIIEADKAESEEEYWSIIENSSIEEIAKLRLKETR